MINLELYKIFKIVADEGNITKASQKLNVSQPAITKHIQNLENQLNNKLFDRNNKGLTLNELGKKLYNEINVPINILENMELKYGHTKCINLGTHVTVFNKVLGKNLSEYYKKYPNVTINIDRSDLAEQLLKLEKQELDIVISKKDTNYINGKIEFIKIMDLHDILIINSKYANFKGKVKLDELKNKVIYMPRKNSITTRNFFESIKNLPNNDIKFNNINYRTILEILKYDSNIGLVTEEAFLEEINSKEFTKIDTLFEIKPLEYGIYINKENKFKELINFVKELKMAIT